MRMRFSEFVHAGRVLDSSDGMTAGYAFFTMVDHRNAAVHLVSTESER